MKNIFKITFRDLKRIIKNPIALSVIIGACFIPALYAWVNIKASWDPYGSTNGLKVAVANNDKVTKVMNIEVNLGDRIKEELEKNNDIGWVFVSEENLIKGVKSGEYYAGVVIPENFSENFTSILTSDIKTPKIDYYVNQKKNAIAPKITDKGVSVVQQQINETFLDVAGKVLEGTLKVAYERLEKDEETIADRMINTLNEVSKSLEQYENLAKSFDESLNATKSLIDTTMLVMPGGQSILKNVEDLTNNINGLIHFSGETFRGMTDMLQNFLGSAEEMATDMINSFEEITKIAGKSTDIIKLQLNFIKTRAERIQNLLINVSNLVKTINSKLPIKLNILDKLVAKIERINTAIDRIISLCRNGETIIDNGGELTDSIISDMKNLIYQVRGDVLDVKDMFRINVKPAIDNQAEKMYKILVDFGLISKNASSIIGEMNNILKGIYNTIEISQKAIQSTNKAIESSKKDVRNLSKKIQDVKSSQLLDHLAVIIKNDPSVVGKFISAPVQIQENSFYEIKNYGSAMTPFYSILSFWVGGVLLVSLLKTRVEEDENITNIKPYQAYLGRYVLFMLIGIAQSLIVCLGDLYILKIQCINPSLFVLAGVVSNIVFINIIYTFVVSFGDVGKAICVFLLVIQVAGAGGTFPIEVTPEFFQKVHPYLPFTYAINAMRETIAGIYENVYLKNIVSILKFLPLSLLLGLVIRKPLIKVNEFFEEKLEETHLM